MAGQRALDVFWKGPFSWPGFEGINFLPTIPQTPGVYLQTFEYKDGCLIYAAGLSRRPIFVRFKEHTRKYMNGEYNVLNISAAQRGSRQEVWHGWGYARTHREDFKKHKGSILEAVHEQLAGFRIFTAEIESTKEDRILERLEASIMAALYGQPPPICNLPDRGMRLAPRQQSEHPIEVENYCSTLLHGLPSSLKI